MGRAIGWGAGVCVVGWIMVCCGSDFMPSLGSHRIHVDTIPQDAALVVGLGMFSIPVVLGVIVFIAVLSAERRKR